MTDQDNITALFECSKCKATFRPDDEHFRITAQFVTTEEQNNHSEYWFCTDCWFSIVNGLNPYLEEQ